MFAVPVTVKTVSVKKKLKTVNKSLMITSSEGGTPTTPKTSGIAVQSY